MKMSVSNIELCVRNECCQLQAHVRSDALDDAPFLLWYRFPKELGKFIDKNSGDTFLAALLAPAMATGESLHIEARVSPRLLDSVEQIQSIYHCWNPSLSKISIEATCRTDQTSVNHGATVAGLFFSLGVDSFYSLLKGEQRRRNNIKRITHLIPIHGFDIAVGNTDLFNEVLGRCEVVGKQLRKEVWPVATNLRKFTDPLVEWGNLYHGAALASVGLALGPAFEEILIAATFTSNNLFPWGSHPLLDPLWSTETLRFTHDGCEAKRIEKIRLLSQSPSALENLRVCYQNPGQTYNCGRCGKCLRTMVELHVAGALQDCKTFPSAIDLKLLDRITVNGPADRTFLKELVNGLGSSPEDSAIKTSLQAALDRPFKPRQASGVDGKAFILWRQQIKNSASQIAELIGGGDKFILVDQDELRTEIDTHSQAVPFLEKQGRYWGPPRDDQTAIQELERLRCMGVPFLVLLWPAFWWLDYYTGFHRRLRAHFLCILENDLLIVFDLRTELGNAQDQPER